MNRELNLIASEFLREYLDQNPDAQLPGVRCQGHAPDHSYSEETAIKFLQQAQESVDRIEVSEPQSLIILRVCHNRRPVQPAFLAGFRRRDTRPVWCYEARLALVVAATEVEALVKTLRARGIEVFTMPAPEPHKGSL
jgi:hypothetical protein